MYVASLHCKFLTSFFPGNIDLVGFVNCPHNVRHGRLSHLVEAGLSSVYVVCMFRGAVLPLGSFLECISRWRVLVGGAKAVSPVQPQHG